MREIPTFAVLREEKLLGLFLGSKWIKKKLLQWPRMAQPKVSFMGLDICAWLCVFIPPWFIDLSTSKIRYKIPDCKLGLLILCWRLSNTSPVGHTIFNSINIWFLKQSTCWTIRYTKSGSLRFVLSLPPFLTHAVIQLIFFNIFPFHWSHPPQILTNIEVQNNS